MRRHNALSVILIILVMIYLLIPLLACVIYSLFSKWTGVVPKGFTLSAYQELFSNTAFWSALGQTMLLCIAPIAITIAVVLLAMYAVVVYAPRLEKYIQIICMIPYTIQGVILSVSILSLYVGSKSVLSSRLVMLIGAYCIIILPYIYQGIRNSMRSINMKTLLEAAEMLGSSRIAAFFRVPCRRAEPDERHHRVGASRGRYHLRRLRPDPEPVRFDRDERSDLHVPGDEVRQHEVERGLRHDHAGHVPDRRLRADRAESCVPTRGAN